jgi:hypothetical protein
VKIEMNKKHSLKKRKSNEEIKPILDESSSKESIINIGQNTILQSPSELLISKTRASRRRIEFHRYLELFGYTPESTILQVHIAGFFNKRQPDPKEIQRRQESVKRYGGTTFVIVGRTHDPSIVQDLIHPKKQDPYQRSSGYLGYLWKDKDKYGRAPHEILPLDFTPTHLPYPSEWKKFFATKGFMIALHVPSSLAKKKNEILRIQYRIGKQLDSSVKDEWSFIKILEESLNVRDDNQGQSKTEEKLQEMLKWRLVNGEITKEEYNELSKIIHS